jgi:lipopolysaccharide transport system ATP-binding protein
MWVTGFSVGVRASLQRTSDTARLPDVLSNAIEARSLRKSYRLYRNQREKIADALGIGWLASAGQPPPRNFVALDDVTFNVGRGERIGIVGRNGAGKSTLLKLISGLLQPTSGSLVVIGSVQVLMYVGLGFHPEFTGLENIRASLLYNGLTPEARKEAEEEVIAFAELNEFLYQPLRTYSLGMRSRLQFACATAVKPEILIVDEILAVGDAYFLLKCAQRVRKLVDTGCTLLLASHSTPQILDFCTRALWVEKGNLADDGSAADVVRDYEQFMARLGSQAGL